MFSDPEKNVAQFGLTERMHVADLGAGSGAYTIAAARRVKEFGKVYAVEVQKELLPRIKNISRQGGLSNVETIWGDIERRGATKIGDESVDAAIVANVLFQAEDKAGIASEVKRILKPEGAVLVVDWKESFGGMGPEPSAVVSPEEAQRLFEEERFILEKTIDAGEHHYGFIARRGYATDTGG